MPDSNPFYELLGGYYPGKPIPRKRPPYSRPPDMVEFNTDALIEKYLFAVRKELDKLTIGNQAKKFFIDDVERTLIAQTKPKGVSYDPMRALELGDEEDVAGVQLELDINPVKWLRNPGEMAKDTVDRFVKDFANWKDFDSYMEQSAMWKPLLSGGEIKPIPGIVSKVYGEHLDESATTKFRPFQLKGLDIPKAKVSVGLLYQEQVGGKETKEFTETETDLFAKSGGAFLSYMQAVRASGTRNKAYRKLINAAALASSAELTQLIDSGDISDPKEVEIVKSYLHRARAIRMANALQGISSSDINTYKFASDRVLTDAQKKAGETLYGEGIGYGLAGLTKELSAYTYGAATIDDANKRLGRVVENITKINVALEEMDNWFIELGGNTLDEFVKDTKPLRNLLKDLDKLKDEKITGETQARNLSGKIGLLQKKYAREGQVKGSLDRMNRKFVETHLLNSPLTKVIFSNDKIVGTKNLANVMEEALRTYKREDFYDLIDRLENDGLLHIAADQFWVLFRERLNGFTPARFLKEKLKRRHYFGLLYDSRYSVEDGVPGDDAVKSSKFFNGIMGTRLFANRQTHNIEGVGKFKFTGNFNIQLGTGLNDRTTLDKSDALHLTGKSFIQLLNGKTGPGVAYKVSYYDGFKELEDVKQRAKSLRKWLMKHNKQLGLKFDANGYLINSPENIEKLKALFKGLDKIEINSDFISILQSKAGILDKLSQRANIIQSKIFKYFKFLAPVAYARNVASKWLSKMATKAISKVLAKVVGAAVAAGTSGIGTVLIPLIEKVVQYVIKKAMDFAAATLKAIKEAKFDAIEKYVEKSAQAVFKLAGYVMGCFGLVVVIPVMVVFIFILTAITPVDPTRMAAGKDFGGGPAAGPPIVCPPEECEVISTVGCFEFLEGWDSGEGPQALSIIQSAAGGLAGTRGRYVDRLCAAGPIEIAWNRGAGCGWARGLNRIEFGDGRCWTYNSANQLLFNWLFAHETGHVYAMRYGMGALGTAQSNDSGYTLPTYVGPTGNQCSTSNNNSEDFAETVGQYHVLSGQCTNVSPSEFWHSYGTYCPTCFEGHYNFATSSFLFGP